MGALHPEPRSLSDPIPEGSDHVELAAELRARTFVVIPAYNEGRVVGDVVRNLRRRYDNVVVVDDGSRDDTYGHAVAASRWALRHCINRGQGAALQTGIRFALEKGAEYVVTFDADGQHRVEDIDRLITALRAEDRDAALGSRFLGREAVGIPWQRRLLLRAAVIFTRVFHRVTVSDAHNGLRAFRSEAARRLDIRLDGMAHATEILTSIKRLGISYVEVPVEIHYTDHSMAKGQSGAAAFRIVLDYVLGRMIK